ncbi:hypothetical protein [Mucilaginibacter sp. PAMB04168]|uniref:hypothetical protein n=1 Tax=Mucilaginibacter sp. PAMB04168 TaxID=3138567 RepID=UPI0031F6FD57
MTTQQRHNLLWLASAITHPSHYTRRQHYYDEVHRLFFTRVKIDYNGARFEIRDSYDKPLVEDAASDLLVRLELINDASSEIVEIPKLNVEDKIAIQTLFLKHFEGVYYYNEIQEAINNQQDDHRFVLDTVLIENDNAAPMAPYWDDYKLRTVTQYINIFGNTVGIK